MSTYSKKYLPLIIGAACSIGIIIGGRLDYFDDSGSVFSTPNSKKKQKLTRLIDYIDYEYVDDVNTDSIVDVTVNGILKNLDPHSTYIPPEQYERVAQNMKGDFVGIGVSFYNINDTIVVIRALEDGPSERAGIKGGDRILFANGQQLFNRNLDNDSITRQLKGAANTKVNLKVYRKTEDRLLDFTVTRGTVPLKSVDAAYMITDDLGYIKINRFAESTYKEFKKALKNLKNQGANQLILDLRNNGGGYLSEAIKIADEFLEDDKLILFTKSKKGEIDKTFATNAGMYENGQVYVLMNENSASASEVVAGALQDNDKGTIVGRRSYGKGLVQREMSLGDGSAVRLTIARYFTPTGRSIQRPYDDGKEAYFDEYLDRYENGELEDAKNIEVADSLKFTTPGGKVVYGGGGIIPDVFVPKDTNYQSEHLNYLLRSGAMNQFTFEYIEKNRSYLNSLDKKTFVDDFEVEDQTVQDYLSYLKEFNYNLTITEYKTLLKRYLKATIGQQLFGNTMFEKLVNQDDPLIDKVKELVEE
ncbi:S41 family peptidase [Gangjinia marincola]|uniref:S41 family peptidase n=1 Tax=Gangjinia marincola TaxID=578463 RepID=A0ABP3XUH9_9FLAO